LPAELVYFSFQFADAAAQSVEDLSVVLGIEDSNGSVGLAIQSLAIDTPLVGEPRNVTMAAKENSVSIGDPMENG
jgi:hypothetical protein